MASILHYIKTIRSINIDNNSSMNPLAEAGDDLMSNYLDRVGGAYNRAKLDAKCRLAHARQHDALHGTNFAPSFKAKYEALCAADPESGDDLTIEIPGVNRASSRSTDEISVNQEEEPPRPVEEERRRGATTTITTKVEQFTATQSATTWAPPNRAYENGKTSIAGTMIPPSHDDHYATDSTSSTVDRRSRIARRGSMRTVYIHSRKDQSITSDSMPSSPSDHPAMREKKRQIKNKATRKGEEPPAFRPKPRQKSVGFVDEPIEVADDSSHAGADDNSADTDGNQAGSVKEDPAKDPNTTTREVKHSQTATGPSPSQSEYIGDDYTGNISQSVLEDPFIDGKQGSEDRGSKPAAADDRSDGKDAHKPAKNEPAVPVAPATSLPVGGDTTARDRVGSALAALSVNADAAPNGAAAATSPKPEVGQSTEGLAPEKHGSINSERARSPSPAAPLIKNETPAERRTVGSNHIEASPNTPALDNEPVTPKYTGDSMIRKIIRKFSSPKILLADDADASPYSLTGAEPYTPSGNFDPDSDDTLMMQEKASKNLMKCYNNLHAAATGINALTGRHSSYTTGATPDDDDDDDDDDDRFSDAPEEPDNSTITVLPATQPLTLSELFAFNRSFLASYFRSMFFIPDPKSSLGYRLTWLSWLIVALLTYVVSETLMCQKYCTPRIASPGPGTVWYYKAPTQWGDAIPQKTREARTVLLKWGRGAVESGLQWKRRRALEQASI